MNPALALDQSKKLQYSNSVQMVAQQKKNPLMGTVTEIQAKGEAQSAPNLYGKLEYQYGEERARRNVENPVQTARRWLIRPPVIKSGQYIDIEDKFDTMTDPTSEIVMAHTLAVMRGKMDRIVGTRIIDAKPRIVDGGIIGGAIEGKRPGGASSPLPPSQFMPVGTTGLSMSKARLAKLTLNTNEFGLEDDDAMYCGISPFQVDDLLGIAAASGLYLNALDIQQLRDGKPTGLMGFIWVVSNRWPYKDGTDNVRLCPVWTKRNIVAGIWEDVNGAAWNDSSADNLPYVRVQARVDCVRIEDKGVVVIECLEG